MPSDKPRKNGIPAKPFTPTLSSTSRTPKTPLTPRLAGAGAPSSYHTPHNSSKPTTPLSSREDISTPVSAFLSTNITPRSGSRNSRRDGTDGTGTPPSDTPPSISFPSRPSSNVGPVSDHSPLASRRVEPGRAPRKKSGPDDGYNFNAQSQPGSSANSSVGSSMFFRADDARSSTSSHEQETKPKPHVKSTATPVFLYANGTAEEGFHSEEPDHAGKKLAPPPRPHIAAKPTGPSLSPFPQMPNPTPKDVRSSDNNTHARTRSQTEQLQNTPVLRPLQQGRRPSIGSNRPSHTKSPSVDQVEHFQPRRQTLLSSPNITSPPNSDPIPQLLPTASPSPNSGVSENTPLSPPPVTTDYPLPLAQSPKRPDGQQNIHLQQANELAANARRERKVLDLEISNSSLLAINRTLEREMRKQNAELRRYRRLSRSGRLSIAGSMRSVSGGGLSIVSETDDTFSELSSALNSPEELSEISDNDSSFADDDTLSPGSVAEHDARHRIRDEKRFFLDLAKHQELLVDSQKMNQSIKRCLSWTEELLRDGKRALAYKVHVSDVEIGGRVLSSDDTETEGGRGLLSSTTDMLDIPEYSEVGGEEYDGGGGGDSMMLHNS
ncbi:hypothetical protein FQN54_003900 [Arachnomyces sp. PD_36]|nr:hypothetical protein FQN54_003900 [Arachnomyces sp. PD_36]